MSVLILAGLVVIPSFSAALSGGAIARYNTRMAEPHRNERRTERRRSNWTVAIILGLILYVLSSGPVIGTAYWLCDVTGLTGFRYVVWVYYPLLVHENPTTAYIEWCVNLFGPFEPS